MCVITTYDNISKLKMKRKQEKQHVNKDVICKLELPKGSK
jgi:hypothetical protein